MNKTININISGIAFTIEEDAYEQLRAYINTLKKHFSTSADSFEIITDIENRLAELFTARLTEGKQVLIAADVLAAISQMGNPVDFDTPDEENEPVYVSETINKRFYRNADDKAIGGVCSGIAAYFNTDAVWIRLGWLFLFFVMGFGFMLYIILWAIVPLAKTRAEKLAMKGEAPTVSNIKKSVEAELKDVKQNFESQSFFTKIDSLLRNVISLFIAAFGGLFSVLLKVLAGFTILVSAGLLIALVGLTFSYLGFHTFQITGDDAFLNLRILHENTDTIISISIFFLLFIPVFLLFLTALRLLIRRPVITKISAMASLVIWGLSIVVFTFYGSQVALDFRESSTLRIIDTLSKPTNAVYYLKSRHKAGALFKTTEFVHKNGTTIKVSDSNEEHSFTWQSISLTLKTADSDIPEIERALYARGNTVANALESCQQVRYNYLQADSIIYLDDYYTIADSGYFRAQKVDLTLFLPENSRVVVDNSLLDIMPNNWLGDCEPVTDSTTILTITKTGITCTGM